MGNKSIPDQENRSVTRLAYFLKMRGEGRSTLKIVPKDALTGLIGGFLTIFSLVILTNITSIGWLIAPFGASCVLAFGVWNSPLSQPRNIIGGHVISTFAGLSVYHLFGASPWSIGLAVGLAVAAMMLTKTTHPPAGADPLVIMMGEYSWGLLVSPVLIGSVIIVLLALLINNLRSDRKYPTFWV
ncbi:HPP family protein [Paraliobacillus zengyii]|uniref:HPP family protein n=1 Tax=Paraliobacillus zengyii TaxID=2213194 RepID=UPI000E3EB287|nr:HPP family protein [Paraliobacillus zengyii]